MSERRCKVCGRVLRKTTGDIGPVCSGSSHRRKKMTKKQYLEMLKKYEIFKEKDDEQGRDAKAD